MFSGGFGGACLWLVIYPMDCVKSRIQVMSMTGKQSGFFKTFMRIFRTEGMRGLFMPNCIYFTFVYMTWTPYLTCFCLIFRCKGFIFWSDSHNDPYISSQRCSVLGLWNQPQNHDGTVWKLTLWQHTFFSGWIWLSFLNELALIHHWPVYSISVNMPWFAHTNAHFYNDALLGFIYLLTLYSKVILV